MPTQAFAESLEHRIARIAPHFTVIDERDVLVNTRILSADRPPLKVDWRMRQLDDGSLAAIDVIVEGVSLVVTQRSEFASVIERQGLDGLLAELRARIQSPA